MFDVFYRYSLKNFVAELPKFHEFMRPLLEVLVENGEMRTGLRQGSYRTNPFVLQYDIDASSFLIGTYRYRVTVTLPDGTTRTSKDFNFSIG